MYFRRSGFDVDSLDSVVGFHGAQDSVVEDRHEEALGEVVQMLTHGEHVVALASRCCVHATALHATAETADGRALVRQRLRIINDSCNTRENE